MTSFLGFGIYVEKSPPNNGDEEVDVVLNFVFKLF
jgi:hypothetical protein